MILAFLAREGLVDRGDVLAPRIASLQDIRRVHSDVYLESLHDLPVLESILGTQIAESQLDEVLDLHRLMVGGTIAAAKIALSSSAVGVNLGGGFHHARPDRGHGFCVYNDLAITVARLRANGFGGRVLVVDLDLHDGDGTRLAFARDPTVHTFSIHNQTWSDAPAAEATTLELGHDFDDRRYLALLDRTLPAVITRFDPGLVLYVSGNDVAADDRLGDGHLTPEAILERDRRVLSWVRGGLRPRPLAVVLGGGYGPDAWRYTARFLSLIISGRALPTPPTDDLRFARLRYLARLMDPRELTGKSELGLTDEDLGGALGYLARRSRLLDYYTRHGVELALERFGFLDHLRALGYPHPYVDLETGRETGDLLRIFGDASKVDLLVELRVRRDALLVPGHEVLFVEWLLLQNPRVRFDDTHPALPGQAHPGLGLLAEVMTLLRLVCDRLHLDAIALVPGHYHVAARARAPVGFVDPTHEASFRAMNAALEGLSLLEATWAVDRGQLQDAKTQAVVRWLPRPMLFPIRAEVATEVFGEAWQAAVAAATPTYVLGPRRDSSIPPGPLSMPPPSVPPR